jgi:hypothetical protein
LSGPSPMTCLAWEALPVAYATASIALGIMWPHKPHHYVKVIHLFYVYVFIVRLCIFIVPAGTLRLPWLRFFRAFSSVVRKMPG